MLCVHVRIAEITLNQASVVDSIQIADASTSKLGKSGLALSKLRQEFSHVLYNLEYFFYKMCVVFHRSCLTRISLPSQVHRQGVTPLHIAAAIGHPDMMLAMIRSTQQRIFEFESGMRISRHKLPPPPVVNVKDTRGRSALHVAAAAGSEACVGLLIQASATVDSEDSDKVTPLAIASACGHKNVVVELIKAGI